MQSRQLWALLALLGGAAYAQTPTEQEEDDAVGQSVNYVFATDLGSGVYDFDGRSLQIYRYTYEKELRETRPDRLGVRFMLPVTAGFFDFSPLDVISEGPPTRIDSFSVAPGFEIDHEFRSGWHLVPYVRAGASIASSSVDGLLYGAGFKLERRFDENGWDVLERTELAYAGVTYRHDTPGDQFLRVRQAFDLTRGVGWRVRGHEIELGMYSMCDFIADPPTAPLADAREAPVQLEIGFTFSSRPRVMIGRFDAPRLGFGYRLAGDLSAWRLVIGAPF
jgi:hypothetical protein